jgi:hypothetical protein
MPKLHIGFPLAQHTVLSLQSISQLHRQIRYPRYLPDQIILGLNLNRVYFYPVDVIEDFIIHNPVYSRVGLIDFPVQGALKVPRLGNKLWLDVSILYGSYHTPAPDISDVVAGFLEPESYRVPFTGHFEEKTSGNPWKFIFVASKIVAPPSQKFLVGFGVRTFAARMNKVMDADRASKSSRD